MLAKPFTFLLVFLLTIVNFMILLVPIVILFFPLSLFFPKVSVEIGPELFFFLVSRISLIIIIYVAFDTILGITVRRLRKRCIPFRKATKVPCHEEITKSFEWLKNKFKIHNVKLYLNPGTREVNAYAVGSFSGSAVIITMGLINQMQKKAASQEEYIDAIRAILGHEMSHLSNKDFMPGLLTAASEISTNMVSRIVRLLFMLVSRVIRIIPWIGLPISQLIITSCNFVNTIIHAFFNYIFMPIYRFLLKFFGRAIEYRCDKESSYAYGGQKMAMALDFLGAGSYFSLFSTHPTTSSRIRRAKNILPKSGVIRPGIINMFSNFASLVGVIWICLYSNRFNNFTDILTIHLNQAYDIVVRFL